MIVGKGKVCDAVQRSEHVNLFRSRIKKCLFLVTVQGKLGLVSLNILGGLLFCSKHVCFMHNMSIGSWEGEKTFRVGIVLSINLLW